MFVYGTLCDTPRRRGWASDARLGSPLLGTTPGLLYNYGPFPYALFGDFDGSLITGQVMIMDTDHPDFAQMHYIECASGYRPVMVTVDTEEGPLDCMAYDADPHTRDHLLPLLPRVESGDWNNLRGNSNV